MTWPEVPFRVERDDAERFLAAMGRPEADPGEAVPPFLLAARALRVSLGELLPATVGGGQGVVHVQHDVRWRQAVGLGTPLVARAELTSARPAGAGAVTTAVVSVHAGGAPVLVQWAGLLVTGGAPGGHAPGRGRRPSVPRRLGTEPFATATIEVDADQAVRYAAAAGDPNPIHVDPEAARSAGLGGVVLHGMCTLALVGQVVADAAAGGELGRLARLAARFAEPVRPASRLAVALWRAGGDGDSEHIAVDARNDAGSRVLRHAFASLARGRHAKGDRHPPGSLLQ